MTIYQERVHQGLECGGSVGHSKWQDQTLVCNKRGMMDRVFREMNFMIARAKVEFAQSFRTKEFVNQDVDVRKRESISNGKLVQASVVDTELKRSNFLLGKQDGSRSG